MNIKPNMQIRFLLTDYSDESYTDLIEFEKPTDLNKVIEEIEKVKKEKEGHYTNEDVYQAIDKVNDTYRIIFLGGYEKIYY